MSRPSALSLLLLLPAPSLVAQCATWAPGLPIAGVDGNVLAVTEWDPDGPGPMLPGVVAGGTFTVAGGNVVNGIARFDPTTGTWHDLGGGVGGANRTVTALATTPNGDLVAAGLFQTAGGVPVNNIAQWNGVAWSPLGAGTDAQVLCLRVLQNGDLLAGGRFTTAGGASAGQLARWDGVAWSSAGLAAGPFTTSPPAVHAIAALPSGDVVVGGSFQGPAAGMRNLAVWSGGAWGSLGDGFSGPVNALLAMPSGELVASGTFTQSGATSTPRIASWNGSNWAAIGGGLGGAVHTLAMLPNGDLVAAGTVTLPGIPGFSIARWGGATWIAIPLPAALAPARASCVRDSGELIVGVDFVGGGGIPSGIAQWDGAWANLGGGTDGAIQASFTLLNGDVLAGGTFRSIGSVVANGVARWNGATWSPVGSGVGSPGGAATALAFAELPNGDLVVGGNFATAGGVPANNVARWDGVAWSPLGAGLTLANSSAASVVALTVLPNGDVVAGGSFLESGGISTGRVARWNGLAWEPAGPTPTSIVTSLLALPNGDFVVGCEGALQWNGTTVQRLGTTQDGPVQTLRLDPNGAIVASGRFQTPSGAASGVARWNGSSWNVLGTMTATTGGAWVWTVATLPDGDVIAGGTFSSAGGVAANNLARWNGGAWTPLGSGANGTVRTTAVAPAGELVVGGLFGSIDGFASGYVARYVSTCVATSTTNGAGCASSGGANELTASSLPWVDATFRARGTGLPNLAIVLALTSLAAVPQGAVPLAALFGGVARPGCDLLVVPDIVEGLLTVNGVAESQLFLPNTPPLVGVSFFHQMVPLEVDPALNVLSITATNSLRLTAGDF